MNTRRYRKIIFFFARAISSFFIQDILLPHLGGRAWSRRTRPERLRRMAAAFRTLAVEMGGVLIKVGQFLSSRVDVLPEEITAELEGLQDEVPAERFPDIRQVVEADFGVPLGEKFVDFEELPVAAASLGQVHRAKVAQGEKEADALTSPPRLALVEVVVKVQRPNIESLIATDLAALRTVGAWLHAYRPIRRRANIPALLDEFTRILYQEIDYLAEGHNAETFAANFTGDDRIRVSQVFWSHTTRRVLTLENVMAIKVSDFAAISAAGIDRGEVASRLIDVYLKQIFEDGFFHADPHPGNLFICPAGDQEPPGDDWQLTFVDFGMVGRVPDNLLQGLREMLIAIGVRDAARLVKSYQMIGVLLPEADLELIEKAEARMFERFWGKSMSELQHFSHQEAAQFAVEFRQLLYAMPFQVPQDMIFLARAVGLLAGICTGLDPDFNVWTHLAPYAHKLISRQVGAGLSEILEQVKRLASIFIAMPGRVDAMLARMERGEMEVRSRELTHQILHLELAFQQVAGGIIFAALFLGGLQLVLADMLPGGYALLFASAVCLVWVIILGRQR
ncbi:MAG: AarF/UbiB family protein [Anaerolineales bacterium]|nr:AarF/UbiB family protein [Anaerolineales bacterium]